MIFQQLDGDVGVGQQLYVVVQLARGDGAGAFLFYLGVAGGAQAEVEVGGGERELVAGGFEEIVRQNRDRGLALDHALGGRQFAQKFRFADRDLHDAGPYRGGQCFNRHNAISRCSDYFLISKAKALTD